ncbi:MAG: hypothetical protein ABIH50_00775 [bacterium]
MLKKMCLAYLLPFFLISQPVCYTQTHCNCCHHETNQCSMESAQDKVADSQFETPTLHLTSLAASNKAMPILKISALFKVREIAPLYSSVQNKILHPPNGPPLA